MNAHHLILASQSPRRAEILQRLGYTLHTHAVDIDETPHPKEKPQDYVQRLAITKNHTAHAQLSHDKIHIPIISADTCVALNTQILGKPSHQEHAATMLRLLSGKTHQVYTSVAVQYQGILRYVVQTNHVTFKTLSEQEITAYIATGEPMDKAGSYGIQGLGGLFVSHLAGSFTGVMGLPIFDTVQLLQQYGIETPPFGS